MDVHPGPIFRDVLVIEAGEHRCDAGASEEYAQHLLKCHRTCTSLYARTLIVNRPIRVIQLLREYGFYGVEKVGGLQLDWALITALVERWRPETHSFHLPFGEVGITLQDVEVLLGLPVDGNPLAGMTGRSRDQWIQICEDMMGFRPQTSDITSTMIKMSAIVPKQLTDHSLDVDYLQHARAIMFKLLGGSLFPNTTGNKGDDDWRRSTVMSGGLPAKAKQRRCSSMARTTDAGSGGDDRGSKIGNRGRRRWTWRRTSSEGSSGDWKPSAAALTLAVGDGLPARERLRRWLGKDDRK
ncbi:unnamed protein product [Cuscuta campestris]|uniref:Aminotransferase-like plant mobile domain-containing protein n=1 Tax=Cuscuta campestris TaxID=132261 RepID=A0A484LDG7_9ASTE|nr:unnamed protein product [Cuscuta campestris]